VSLAVFIPVSGWMADRYGLAHGVRSAIAVFVIGSLACGFSSSRRPSSPRDSCRAWRRDDGPGSVASCCEERQKRELVAVLSFLTMPGAFVDPRAAARRPHQHLSTARDLLHQPADRLAGWYFAGRLRAEIVEERGAPLDLVGFVLSGVGCRRSRSCGVVRQHLLPTIDRSVRRGRRRARHGVRVACPAAARREGRAPVLDFRFLRTPTYFVGVVGGRCSASAWGRRRSCCR